MQDSLPITQRPRLLMLSHCVPSELGDAHRRRAWRLLAIASLSHDVDLACVVEDTINLRHWQRLADRTRRVALEGVSLRQRFASWRVRHEGDEARRAAMLRRALLRPLELLEESQKYDALVCSHTQLWPRAAAVSARIRVCDMGPVRNSDTSAMDAAHQCDVLTLRMAEDARCFVTAPCRKLVLPSVNTEEPHAPAHRSAAHELGRLLRQTSPATFRRAA